MIEPQVYASAVRERNKTLDLEHELKAVPGLRHKVDGGDNIVSLERGHSTNTSGAIRNFFVVSASNCASLTRPRRCARALTPAL